MTDLLLACLFVGAPLWIVIGLGLLLWPLGWLVLWVRDWYEAVEAAEEGGEEW